MNMLSIENLFGIGKLVELHKIIQSWKLVRVIERYELGAHQKVMK